MSHRTEKWKSIRLKDLTLVAHFPAPAPFTILHDTISLCSVLLWWFWAKCRKLHFMYSEDENEEVVGSKRSICWANQLSCYVKQFIWLSGIKHIVQLGTKKVVFHNKWEGHNLCRKNYYLALPLTYIDIYIPLLAFDHLRSPCLNAVH